MIDIEECLLQGIKEQLSTELDAAINRCKTGKIMLKNKKMKIKLSWGHVKNKKDFLRNE